jgi:hypothetical protein
MLKREASGADVRQSAQTMREQEWPTNEKPMIRMNLNIEAFFITKNQKNQKSCTSKHSAADRIHGHIGVSSFRMYRYSGDFGNSMSVNSIS